MSEQAIVQCPSCHNDFPAAMPLGRTALARSGLMFMVETCPHCSETRSYFKSEYRYAVPVWA